MAVKVGSSWVSEAALSYAKERSNSNSNHILDDLSAQYAGISFSANTAPYSQSGVKNIQIAPNILSEMQNDPEKRLEYEALIYDCATGIRALDHSGGGFHTKAAGYIINADGSLGAWGISESNGNQKSVQSKVKLDKNEKGTWQAKIREDRDKRVGQKKPKKVRYNFKEVSARILQAKTSGNAGKTVMMAREKLAGLRQKLKSSEYDQEEVAAAIAHAEKMVKIAQKKQKHLKAEEDAERGMSQGQDYLTEDIGDEDPSGMEEVSSDDSADMSGEELEQQMQQMEQMQQLMDEAMAAAEEMEELEGMDELSEDLMASRENMSPEDLEMWKKKHRAEEYKEMIEADMKYLKAMYDKWQREKESATSAIKNTAGTSPSDAVSVEIGGVELPVSDAAAPTAVEGANMDVTV